MTKNVTFDALYKLRNAAARRAIFFARDVFRRLFDASHKFRTASRQLRTFAQNFAQMQLPCQKSSPRFRSTFCFGTSVAMMLGRRSTISD
jgi:hypothetical protein